MTTRATKAASEVDIDALLAKFDELSDRVIHLERETQAELAERLDCEERRRATEAAPRLAAADERARSARRSSAESEVRALEERERNLLACVRDLQRQLATQPNPEALSGPALYITQNRRDEILGMIDQIERGFQRMGEGDVKAELKKHGIVADDLGNLGPALPTTRRRLREARDALAALS
jgi:hypothetical protein